MPFEYEVKFFHGSLCLFLFRSGESDNEDDIDGGAGYATLETEAHDQEEEEEVNFKNEASEHLLLADEIQRELADVDDEEVELEERGLSVEKSLRQTSTEQEGEDYFAKVNYFQ